MPRELIAPLLQHGATVSDPSLAVQTAAKTLEQLELIEVERTVFVRCADPADGDFGWSDRLCDGQIELPANDSEPLDAQCCPDCGRLVFADGKKRHQLWRVHVRYEGIVVYIERHLVEAGLNTTAVCRGVLRADTGPLGPLVCIAEYCAEPKFLTQTWAATQPTCYVTVDPRERLLEEDWICRVSLAELVCGDADLGDVVRQLATAEPPANLRHAAIPLFGHGPRPQYVESRPQTAPRTFVVQLSADCAWVQGIKMVSSQAGPRYAIFRLLWARFAEDLAAGRPADEFHALPLADIVRELEVQLGTAYPDETTVRRNINRLQADTEMAVKRQLGWPIDREDIIETCTWKGQRRAGFGYRLNPHRVVLGAGRGD